MSTDIKQIKQSEFRIEHGLRAKVTFHPIEKNTWGIGFTVEKNFLSLSDSDKVERITSELANRKNQLKRFETDTQQGKCRCFQEDYGKTCNCGDDIMLEEALIYNVEVAVCFLEKKLLNLDLDIYEEYDFSDENETEMESSF